MRLVDIVIGSVLVGAALGFTLPAHPSAATVSGGVIATSTCNSFVCGRLTWLRTPLMRRSAQGN